MSKIDFAGIEKGVNDYLDAAFREDKIDRQSYDMAKKNTVAFLKQWLEDKNFIRLSPNLHKGIIGAAQAGRWEDIVNTYRKKMSFGTGGIRGFMASDRDSIVQMQEQGLDAPILKGPNTINNIVLLLTSAGVAKYGRDNGLKKIVLGYDSRVRGGDFAKAIAELFLAYDFTVYLFDEACPFPEVTFAIPFLVADMGILLSASHNDYRYNGYKLCSKGGAQFDPEQRTDMYNNYIVKVSSDDILLTPLDKAPKGRLVYLGGDKKLPGVDYGQSELVDIHGPHREHIKSFLLQSTTTNKQLNVGFCPYHGAGRIAVPRLLSDIGFKKVFTTHENGLYDLNGLFPSFNSDPGMEQQPDPGDRRAAKVAIEAFKKEYGQEKWDELDILIGTDPDADRCGITVKVPEKQRSVYGGDDYTLMPADDAWALLLWYRLKLDRSINKKKSFIVLSHTTTDALTLLAKKYGVGVIKTWVGFAALSASVNASWNGKLVEGLVEGKHHPDQPLTDMVVMETHGMNKQRTYNLGAFEQSNGFSLLGFPPKNDYSLGEKGHVRDKDGTFAAILMAEIGEWAKDNNTTIFELIDKKIYLDKEIGLFFNHYEPDPLDGEYPGIEGDRIKKAILRRALGYYQLAKAGGLVIGGLAVTDVVMYRTGKYDHVYPPTPDWIFPDEGIRFYFGNEYNHLTVRPSGTGNSLRFHIQMHTFDVNGRNLIGKKKDLRKKARRVADHIRELLGAPRNSELV